MKEIKKWGGYLGKFLAMLLFVGSTNAWAQEYEQVAVFKSANVINNSTTYQEYERDGWYISIGGYYDALGFSSKKAKTIGDNLGTEANAQNYGVYVKSLNILNSVSKVTFVNDSGEGSGKIYLAASTDGITWTQVEGTKGETLSTKNNITFEFNKIDAAYFGVVLDKGDKTAANYRIKNVVMTFYASSTDPAIVASDVEYVAEDTSGEVVYEIKNPVEGTNLAATTETEWISNVTVEDGKVTFTMEENIGAAREGVITLTYGEATKDIKVRQGAISRTITWSVNGVETTTKVEDGKDITFTDPTTGIPVGYKFMGWLNSELAPTDEAPVFVKSATASADVTYYAVFAKVSGEGTEVTATLTASFEKENNTYTNHTYTDDMGNTWNSYSNESINIDRFGLNTTTSPIRHFESPTFDGNITKIEIKTYNGSSTKDRYFYFDAENNTTGKRYGEVTAPAGEHCTAIHTFIPTEKFNKFFIHVSDALGFNYLAVTYSSVIYSGYTTSVKVPVTTTISIAEACHDKDGVFYGTYSNSYAFIVPADLTVSEINVNDNQLQIKSYNQGDIVPANTGVMVAATEAGDHEVELSSEEGTSVLGESNMLKASGNSINAETMATVNSNCKFYRLTMHKGETIGYFWGAAEGAAFNLAANKAYLAVPIDVAANIQGFTFESGDTDGIKGVETGNNVDSKVYNLQGQRVAQPTAKGVYITNGRKFIVK